MANCIRIKRMPKIFVKVYCVVRDGDKVLLTQDMDGQSGWKFPGGHLEEGELVADAAKREVKEETGYEIKLEEVFHIDDYFKENAEHHMRIFYTAHKISGEPQPRAGEVKEMKWFNSFNGLEIYPPHKEAFENYRKHVIT